MTRRTLASLGIAVLVGIVLASAAPFPTENPFLALTRAKAPAAYWFLRLSYLVMLLTTPYIIVSGALGFLYLHVYKPRAKDDLADIPLPTLPEADSRETLWVALGEIHHPTEKRPTEEPTWAVIPEKGLVTGMACFGAIGSGKTSAFIRPVALQLFRWQAHNTERRIGGIILEVKGDFCEQVATDLRNAGRADDYLELSLSTDFRYNPLNNPDLDQDALAYSITTLIANIHGKSKDPFWPMASTNCIKFLILLHRLVYDYVTLTDIYYAAINPARVQAILNTGMTRFNIQESLIISAETYAEHNDKLGDIPFDQHAEGDQYIAPLTQQALQIITRLKLPHQTETTVLDPNPTPQHDQYLAVRRWFQHDWSAIDAKLRTSIVEGISVFLSLFDTNPDAKRIFCPPKDTYDAEKNAPDANGRRPHGTPFPSLSTCIEEGKVIGLNFPVAANPVLARTIGTLLKLDYQRAVILRIPQMAANPKRHFRPTVFCCDEYQNFATVGESGTGDQHFFALSRQPKCIGIVATQSVISLRNVLGDESAYKTLLQTFRTKIFLNTADDVTAKYASDLCGKEDKLQESYSVSEGNQDAKTSLLTGATYGSKTSVSASRSFSYRQLERFGVKDFYNLKNAQAIAILFDGVDPLPASLLYLKPYFLPANISWWDQYRKGMLK